MHFSFSVANLIIYRPPSDESLLVAWIGEVGGYVLGSFTNFLRLVVNSIFFLRCSLYKAETWMTTIRLLLLE